MSIASITLVLFIILFPGFAFQALYHSGAFSRKYFRTNVFTDIASAILPAMIYHALAIMLIHSCAFFPYEVSFKAIGTLFMGADKTVIPKVFEENIGEYIGTIFTYVMLSIVIGAASGYCGAGIIRRNGIDLNFPLLRFDNEWHYIMTGEIKGWRESDLSREVRRSIIKRVKSKEFDVKVKILCCVNDQIFIYKGKVSRYFLNKEGLDAIHLKDCYRIPFPKTMQDVLKYEPNEGKKQELKVEDSAKNHKIALGDDIVLFASNIENIDIDYRALLVDETIEGEITKDKVEKFLKEKGYKPEELNLDVMDEMIDKSKPNQSQGSEQKNIKNDS